MASHIKTELSPPPPLLAAFESAAPRRCFALSLCVGLVWITLGAGDWFMRFHWFGWQRNIVIEPLASQTKSAVATVLTNAPRRGGDLSKLIGIPRVAAQYEEDRAGATNFVDAAGYRNSSAVSDRYPVVVVGDSYAASGLRFDDTLAAQLSSRLGVPVYNHAAEGRGTFWAAARFFASDRFIGREPRVVVWPLIEREIAGEYFQGGYYQILSAGEVVSNTVARAARVDWNQLVPTSLRRSLPNSSVYSLLASRVWNRIRYDVFGQVNPSVVPSTSAVAGGPMLFYSEGIRAHRWSDEQRKLPATAKALRDISMFAAHRGITVLFVLVPDKERVYSHALPSHVRNSVRSSMLPLLEEAAKAEGVEVLSLHAEFLRHASSEGALLFWRDDTHWNPAGVAMAAALIEPRVRALLDQQRDKAEIRRK